MASPAERLTPTQVLATIATLLVEDGFLQRMTRHRASGAMVRQYGLLATKPAALACGYVPS
jgi:hypothetical protein